MEAPKINLRIKQIIDFKANGSVNKFAKTINIPQQTINRLFNLDTRTNKYPLATTEIIVSITELYVDINAEWLLTGRGKMVNSETTTVDVKHVDNEWLLRRIEDLAVENAFIKKENEELKQSRGTPTNTPTYSFTEKIGTQIAAEPKHK